MFILQDHPIDIPAIKKTQTSTDSGALTSFEGLVRNDHSHGHEVSALFYQSDTTACNEEGYKILAEALGLFPIHKAVCIQRIGQVPVGETAVWIGVWAGHRDESFKACRYIIEEIKKRLHIWKKEIYTDGTSAWIHGADTTKL